MELGIIVTIYFGALFAIIFFAAKSKGTPKSLLDEQYLAGRSLGPAVLGVSLCASMFSGYTVIGIPAEAFSTGFSAWRWIGSCTFISIVCMLYMPRLYRLAKAKGYNSVLDVVRDRYALNKTSPLYWVMIAVYMVPCFVYTWNQFVAFSNTVFALSDGAVPKVVGSFGLMALLVAYEVIGGLRAVAWTDLLQGCVLVTGSMAFLFVMVSGISPYGSITDITEELLETDPGHVTVMDAFAGGMSWAQFWIGVGFQRALFPDYVARVMAADSEKTLRTAQLVLLAAPFFVQMPLCFVGLAGRVAHPETENSKAIFSLVVKDLINSGSAGRIFGSLGLAASLAAIMSTADSCLIAVSHMVTLDVIKPIMGEAEGGSIEETDKKLLNFGRGVTLALAFVCAALAAAIDVNLSFMIQFQSAFLSQMFVGIVLGMYFKQLSEMPVLAGLIIGEIVAVGLVSIKFPGGVIIGLVLNIVVTFAAAAAIPNTKELPAGFGFEEKATEIASAVTSTGELRKEPFVAAKPMILVAFLIPWLAIPFYRQGGAEDSLLMGVPVWAVCSLVVLALSHIFIGATLVKGWDVEEPVAGSVDVKTAEKIGNAEPEAVAQ
jgi:SSS family solute:Na+ symporter/sodium/pantothenate symporter